MTNTDSAFTTCGLFLALFCALPADAQHIAREALLTFAESSGAGPEEANIYLDMVELTTRPVADFDFRKLLSAAH